MDLALFRESLEFRVVTEQVSLPKPKSITVGLGKVIDQRDMLGTFRGPGYEIPDIRL